MPTYTPQDWSSVAANTFHLCPKSPKMRINPRVVSSAAAIALTCAVTAAAYFYKSRCAELNDLMVFCKLQYNAHSCFDKIISYVEAAKNTVCVCMPGIHNPAIQGRLVKLMKNRNIKVRIIIDRTGYNESTDFFLKELIDAGAEIKWNGNPTYRMQHKFCLVDDKVLMTGTLNWGNDRTSDHWNYVYVTNKNRLVEPVKNQYYKMWNEFSNGLMTKSHTEGLKETCSDIPSLVSDTDSDTDMASLLSDTSLLLEHLAFQETVT